MENKQFEDWYNKKDSSGDFNIPLETTWTDGEDPCEIIGFDKLPFSMRWGVYLEFFESKGLFIMLNWTVLKERGYQIKNLNSKDVKLTIGWFGSYTEEAQKKAIDKAFEILHQQEANTTNKQ